MAGQDTVILSPEIANISDRNKVQNNCSLNCSNRKVVDVNIQNIDQNKYQINAKTSKKLANLETILQELYFLEARLKKEQKEIWKVLELRDHTISLQKQEIDKLKKENKKLLSRARKQSEKIPDNMEHYNSNIKSIKDISPFHKTNGIGRNAHKLPYNLFDSKEVKRVCHKPPIAEKPKLNASGYIVTTCALKSTKSSGKGCNIATTISQLLNEEVDHGIAISSGSESSSPESTLKQSLPKISRMGRSPEKNGPYDLKNIKSFITEDHEVTSGYNSDTVSEQDHDYENIELRNSNNFSSKDRQIELSDRSHSNTAQCFSQQDDLASDHPIYSNIEYAEQKLRDGSDVIEALNLQVGSVSSLADNCTSKLFQGSKNNVPRNRSNINQLMEAEDKHVIMQNFEEFSLDSLDLDSYEQNYIFGKENSPVELTRHSGDGAESKNGRSNNETRNSATNPSSGGYEKFLEATGLSQKSILTPSRMLSNHRSMLKPRDIKHRNKLRVYFTGLPTLEEGSVSQSGCTPRKKDKKYWREPFL